MNAREGLYLSIGINIALVLAVVAYQFHENEKSARTRVAEMQQELEKARADAEEARAARASAMQKELAEAKARAELAVKLQMEIQKRAAEERQAQAKLAAAERTAAAAAAPQQLDAPKLTADQLFDQAAVLEQDGRGPEAVRTYTRAARSGSAKAAKRLGEIYDKGIPGISRDYAESLKWYNTARALGEDVKDLRMNSAEDLLEQALSLEQAGKGDAAVFAYRKAARNGSGKAANRLGEIYGQGIAGVDMNFAESLKWCNTARALGETPNCAAR